MCDVTVVVLTYNPVFEKLLYTLYSIINQKGVSFDIVIADDGSRIFEKERLISWFSSHGFDRYSLILNPHNEGTMKNAFSAWNAAKGRYIKQLSPGDCLYEENSLAKCLSHIESSGSTLVFGAPAGYSITDEGIVLSDSQCPRDLGPYYGGDGELIKQNYIQKFDYVNGMAFMCRRDVLLTYGEKLLNRVKYAEDCTYVLMVADGVKISFMNDYVIWYEIGTGISAGNNKIWVKRLAKDNRECFKIIADDHPQYSYIGKYCFNSDRNILIRLFSRFARRVYERKLQNNAGIVHFSMKSDVAFLKEIISKAIL